MMVDFLDVEDVVEAEMAAAGRGAEEARWQEISTDCGW